MNKKQEYLLHQELEDAKTLLALRAHPEIEPDVAPPEKHGEIRNGWDYNLYNSNVKKACSSSAFHGCGIWNHTDSQDPIFLYSTEKLAYQALLGAMSLQFAKQLRAIELKIEELENKKPEP